MRLEAEWQALERHTKRHIRIQPLDKETVVVSPSLRLPLLRSTSRVVPDEQHSYHLIGGDRRLRGVSLENPYKMAWSYAIVEPDEWHDTQAFDSTLSRYDCIY